MFIVDDFSKLPPDVQNDAKNQDADNGIYGSFKHGKVYLVRDFHKSIEGFICEYKVLGSIAQLSDCL